MRIASLLFRALVPAIGAMLLVSACATSPVETIKDWRKPDPTKPYIGKTKAEIIACAGQPYSHFMAGTVENLIYHYNGAGPVPGNGGLGDAGGKKKKAKSSGFGLKQSSGTWDCVATFSLGPDGRVAHIVYAYRTAQADVDENGRHINVPTCQFTLPNCPAR